MTRARHRIPESFDPQFRQVLLRGVKEAFALDCGTNSRAIRFRADCHAYRFACQRANDPDFTLMARVELKIKRGDSVVYVGPRHKEFEDIFKAAGAQSTTLSSDPLAGLIAPSTKEKQ